MMERVKCREGGIANGGEVGEVSPRVPACWACGKTWACGQIRMSELGLFAVGKYLLYLI